MTKGFERGYDCLRRKAYQEALHWFRVETRGRWLEPLNLNAAAHVGYCHEKGYGTPQDLFTALQWYRLAVDKGGQKWEKSWVGERLREIEKLNPQPPIKSTFTINDYRIGRIINTPDSKPFSVRIKDGCIYVNGSIGNPFDKVVGLVMRFIKDRAESRNISIPDVVDERCYADYDCFKVRIERGTDDKFSHRVYGCCYTILAPHDVCFEHLAVRETLVNYIRRLIKDAAKRYLVPRLAYVSEKVGLEYSHCEIKSLSGDLGRFWCNTKLVELSSELVLYDTTTIDAVIVHELCHQITPNHSRSFYDALLQYGGQELHDADKRLKHVAFKLDVR